MPEPERPVYSFVVPIFNEEATIGALWTALASLLDRLDRPSEVIFVNDGSRDRSYDMLLRRQGEDDRIRIVNLSRNFGHQVAITAGMDLCVGDAVVIMDADLQDPPEVVLDLVERWRDGYDIVYAIRRRREGESVFKRATAKLFYRLLLRMSRTPIPLDAGDFRLVDRRAIEAFTAMREHSRFVRGMFSWVGLRQTGVYYDRAERVAGETKYPIRKMLRFATDGLVSFSDVPLRGALWGGVLMSVGAILYGLMTIGLWVVGVPLPQGWVTLVVLLTFVMGMNLLMNGVMGLYIGRIHEEVKNRPLYVVSELHGFARVPQLDRALILPARHADVSIRTSGQTSGEATEATPVVTVPSRETTAGRPAGDPVKSA